jgi:hypothetical protein
MAFRDTDVRAVGRLASTHFRGNVGSQATAHYRFVAWTKAGLWRRLHRAVLDRLGEQAAIDWSRAVVDAAGVRAKKGLVDRPEPGRPGQARVQAARATEAAGLPLAVAVSAANTHDSLALILRVHPILPIRPRRVPPRRRPAKLHADRGYDYPHLRA